MKLCPGSGIALQGAESGFDNPPPFWRRLLVSCLKFVRADSGHWGIDPLVSLPGHGAPSQFII